MEKDAARVLERALHSKSFKFSYSTLFGVFDIRALIRFSQNLDILRNFARTSPDLWVPFKSVSVLLLPEIIGIFGHFLVFFFSVSCPRSRESNHIASQGEPSHRVTLSSVSKFFSYLRAASSKIWRNRIAHVKLGFRGGSIHVILAPCPTDPLFLRLCILLKIASCSDHASEAKCSN